MTNWLPDLSAGTGPLYLRLADRIEADIGGGVLAGGTKLPPQRDLAYDIGVTVGTVGRAYALLRERGLVSGEVGRGTYVRDRDETAVAGPVAAGTPPLDGISGTRLLDPPTGKLRFDSTAAPDIGQTSTIGTIVAEILRDHPDEVSSYTRRFPDHWFVGGARWLARNGFEPAPRTVVPTLGAHAAIVSVIAAMTSPGDSVVFENLTYSQVARSAGLIGRRTVLVGSDDDGMRPDDFEHVCAQRHPRMAFLMPTAQNPTLANMPLARRREIAEIARRHNVWLIEDDLYGALSDDPTPLVASFAPERTFLIGGLSKSVAAGVRGGWVACPTHHAQRVRVAHKMVTGGMPFLLTELCARLVVSGQAGDIRARCIEENNARLAIARAALARFEPVSRQNIPFLWLALPEPWLSGTFKKAAFEEGVLIDDEDEFKAGRTGQALHRVRIGISAVASRNDVTTGIEAIRRLLEGGRAGYDSFG